MTGRHAWLPRAAALLALGTFAGCNDDSSVPAAIEVRGAWVRPTPAGASTGAVYMTVRAGVDDALVAVGVDPSVAATGIAHETVTSGSQTSMEHAAVVRLPAGDDVAFEPGGRHVMLESLAAPLVAGESFELTLDFDVAPDLTVTVDVREDAP